MLMEKGTKRIMLVIALVFLVHTESALGEVASVQLKGYVAVPLPPSFLPNPYRGAEFQSTNNEDAIYAEYLQKTEMFPDDSICESNLIERLKGDSES